jgi:hypothetical protein
MKSELRGGRLRGTFNASGGYAQFGVMVFRRGVLLCSVKGVECQSSYSQKVYWRYRCWESVDKVLGEWFYRVYFGT